MEHDLEMVVIIGHEKGVYIYICIYIHVCINHGMMDENGLLYQR